MVSWSLPQGSVTHSFVEDNALTCDLKDNKLVFNSIVTFFLCIRILETCTGYLEDIG